MIGAALFPLPFVACSFSYLFLLRIRRRQQRVSSGAGDDGDGSITALLGRVAQFPHDAFSEASVAAAIQFRPRPTDVFILTPPKTGTTWVTQICHAIRTVRVGTGHDRGLAACLAGDDIYQVAPWAQMSLDLGIDLDRSQTALDPCPAVARGGGRGWARRCRLFKTHQRLGAINRGAGYIAVVRRPEDVVQSWYNFLVAKDVPMAAGASNICDFLRSWPAFFLEGMRFGATLWEYYREFHVARRHPDVLVLVYEDLVDDLQRHVPIIAEFMARKEKKREEEEEEEEEGEEGLRGPLTPDEIALVCDRSSRDFMLAHSTRFDESWAYEQLQRVGTAQSESFKPSPRVSSTLESKTKKKKAGGLLDEGMRATMARKWKEQITDVVGGVADYDDLVAEARLALKERYPHHHVVA